MRKFLLSLLLLAVLLTTSCVSFKSYDIEEKEGNAILWVIREDAAFSLPHNVHVSLNGFDIGSLEQETFKILHVVPGIYEIRFIIEDSGGKQLKDISWEGEITADYQSMAIVNYTFGWKSFERYIKKKASTRIRGNDGGEVDLTETVSPR